MRRPALRSLIVTSLVALCLGGLASPGLGAAGRTSPIRRAIDYLLAQQVRKPLNSVIDGRRVRDFPGDWPQSFTLRGADAFRIRDVSPFTVAFIHHALSHIVDDNRRALGVSGRELQVARLMRRRAVTFLRRFESAPDAADAGTFGFWPYDANADIPGPWLENLLITWLKGPILGGQRVPLNLSIYPHAMAIPTDADVTATTYAALLDDARLDGGSGSQADMARLFVDWRDVGAVPRRLNPSWLPPQSGAFLTWLAYRDIPQPVYPNDVDLVVNANVLYSLARHGRLDAPGVADAVGLINRVTGLGIHREHPDEIADYYPDNLVFHYAVSRAFAEGPVRSLEPAVRVLADDIESSAIVRPDGTVYWDRGDPNLNTAFAVITLLNAGRRSPLVERAIAYLTTKQDAAGGFGEATFFIGRAEGGQVFEFSSASFTTAMVLEALAQHAMTRE